MKILIKRVYHPYWKWEEIKYNMWDAIKPEEHDKYFRKAIKFTGNHKLYGKWMKEVVKQWKYSCEHNLSNTEQNRRAWIGHAACALAFKCPEDIIRAAWWQLTDKQRELANKEADKAIQLWERKYAKKTLERKRIIRSKKKN